MGSDFERNSLHSFLFTFPSLKMSSLFLCRASWSFLLIRDLLVLQYVKQNRLPRTLQKRRTREKKFRPRSRQFSLKRTKVLIIDPNSLLQLRHFLRLDASFRLLLCLFWAFLSLLTVYPLHPRVCLFPLWVSVFLNIHPSPKVDFQTDS